MKKRALPFSVAICVVCLLTSCSAAEARADSAALTSEIETVFTDVPADAWYAEAAAVMNCARLSRRETGKVLVAYFSATGNTRPVAEKAAEDMEQYDAVLIGYPIWWGRAPKIIHTFLETYDLSGKTIAAFCTSGSSPHEDASIRGYEPDAAWLEGRRFSGTSQVESWINGLDLPKSEEDHTVGAFNFDSKTVTLNSGCEMPLNGLGTYSFHGDACVSSVKSALRSGVRLIDGAASDSGFPHQIPAGGSKNRRYQSSFLTR